MLWYICLNIDFFSGFFRVIEGMVEVFLHTIIRKSEFRLKKSDYNMSNTRTLDGSERGISREDDIIFDDFLGEN